MPWERGIFWGGINKYFSRPEKVYSLPIAFSSSSIGLQKHFKMDCLFLKKQVNRLNLLYEDLSG
jgi:hypothetical protein